MKPDIKGLTKLAQHIRRVPKKQFDIGTWVTTKPSCGTVGCIAGWAATVFPSRFKKVLDFTYNDSGGTDYCIVHKSSGLEGEYAFARGFRISDRDAVELTLEKFSTKRTPKKAANAIMKLVAKLKK